MAINPVMQTQWTPAVNYVRALTQSPALPQVRPVEPIESNPAPAVEPKLALRAWLSQYSSNRELYDRVAADPSPQGTLFRRGLMISGVVNLGTLAE